MLLSKNGVSLLMMMAGDVVDEEVAGGEDDKQTDHDHSWMSR